MTNKEKAEIRRRVLIRIESLASDIGSQEGGYQTDNGVCAQKFAEKFLGSVMNRARKQLDKMDNK